MQEQSDALCLEVLRSRSAALLAEAGGREIRNAGGEASVSSFMCFFFFFLSGSPPRDSFMSASKKPFYCELAGRQKTAAEAVLAIMERRQQCVIRETAESRLSRCLRERENTLSRCFVRMWMWSLCVCIVYSRNGPNPHYCPLLAAWLQYLL